MKLIMCVAMNRGIAFNHRRQSRDEKVCKDIAELAGNQLCISSYSASLFEGISEAQICEDVRKLENQYYFAEREMPEVDEGNITEVVLYHWNRDYPADVFFDLDLSKYQLQDTKEFEGKSHECIRREIWKK